jgi:nonribosomal peptide synthetase DhbF
VERKAIEQSCTGTSSSTEQTLREIWCDVLGLWDIDLDDNFFDLGGHSFLAIQAISRVREIFGVELSLVDFLEAPTARGQARAVALRAHR